MTRNTIAQTFTIGAVTALALGIAPTTKAQVNKGCSTADMLGTFAYTNTGNLVAAPAPLADSEAEFHAVCPDSAAVITGIGRKQFAIGNWRQ